MTRAVLPSIMFSPAFVWESVSCHMHFFFLKIVARLRLRLTIYNGGRPAGPKGGRRQEAFVCGHVRTCKHRKHEDREVSNRAMMRGVVTLHSK